MKRKTQLIVAAAILLIVAGVFGGAVYAQTPTPVKRGNIFSELVDFISQKLGLKKEQVQTVVNEFQTQKRQAMQKNAQVREQSRFDGLVKSGKITEAQKTAILAELKALQEKYNPANLKDQTPAERKTQTEKMGEELNTWAKAQGIDPSLIMPGFGGRGAGVGRGFGGRLGGKRPTPTP